VTFDVSRLWQRSQKDLITNQPTWLKRYSEVIDSGLLLSANMSLTSTNVVPVDTIRIINCWSAFWTPGAAQPAQNAQLLIEDANSNILQEFYMGAAFNAAVRQGNWAAPLEIVLHTGEFCVFTAEFSAGGVNNRCRWSVIGWEMPRGSLQR
jgi:hypothetical protein